MVLHLLGWAIVLGGALTNLRIPRIVPGMLHGVLTALVTGILLTVLAATGSAGHEPNFVKLGVKLALTLVVTWLIVVGARPGRSSRGLVVAVAGLTVANVAIAVLWR